MEGKPNYQEYIDWGQDRYKIVEEIKHEQPSDISWIKIQLPQHDFIQLYGEQDGKAIKIKTYRQKVSPQFAKPKAVIVFFHNIGMTGQTIGHFAEDLSKKGFQTVAFDIRGHGMSQGQKGYIEKLETTYKDIQNFVKKVQQLYPGIPMFALGDGVGCLVLLNLIRDKKKLPFTGIIFSGPSFGRPQRSKVLAKISQFSLKLMPNKTGIFAFQYQNYSRNPKVGELLRNHKLLYHQKVCVGTLSSLTALTKQMNEKTYKKLQFPTDILIIQGQNDKGCDAFNTIKFYQNINCKKELLYYKKMWHNFMWQKQYEQVKSKIQEWINKRL